MKETPKVKIYEAWTAVADGNRIELAPGSTPDEGRATVRSSDGAKSYDVGWRDKGRVFVSTDPATYWQGYAGYPVVAVLMKLGLLPYCAPIAGELAGINWTELNKRMKRDYVKAVSEVESERGIDSEAADEAAEKVVSALNELNLTIKRK